MNTPSPMTAELQDERLAELHGDTLDLLNEFLAVGGFFNPELMERAKSQNLFIRCRDELQAYRAKRETHVWVPRETLAFARNAVARLYGPEDLVKFDAMLAASDGNPP